MGSPSISPVNTMMDWTNSLYYYGRQRILAINPQRQFGGIVDATDWPPIEAKFEAFYLKKGTGVPVRSSSIAGNSWSGPRYSFQVEWVWQIIGDDIGPTQVGPNRGDRYSKHFQMMQELLTGLFPGYAAIYSFTANPDNSGDVLATPFSPAEFIDLSKPVFSDETNKNLGILFGSAKMFISSFSPAINS